MKTALLFLLCALFILSCVEQPDSTNVTDTTQAVCNPANDDCIGGHITRDQATTTTSNWEHNKLASIGHPDTAYSTRCDPNGSGWTCTSKGEPIWPDWPGGNSHWLETTCDVSGYGISNCYTLDCYNGLGGLVYCGPA